MDVGDGCVVHAAAAAGVGVQGGFEDGAEDGGADGAPVEAVAHFFGDEAEYIFGEAGDFYISIMEEAAIDVGEGHEVVSEVGVAAAGGGVEDVEEFDEGVAGVFPAPAFEVGGEAAGGAEEAGVFGVEAEDDADAEDIEGALGGGVLRVFVLGEEGVVEAAHEFAGFDGDLDLFSFAGLGCLVYEEVKLVVVGGEVGEGELHGLTRGFGFVHVVDPDLVEVRGDDVAGSFADGQGLVVFEGLLVGGGEGAAVAFVGLVQGDA